MIGSNDSPQVKVAKGAAIIFAGIIFARLVNYLYQIVLARGGGTAEFGLFFLGVSTITVAGGIATFGLDLGVARFVPLYIGSRDENRLRGVLRYSIILSMVVGAGAGVVLWLSAGLIAARLLGMPNLVGILQICALCLPFYVSGRVLVKTVVAFQKIGYRVALKQVLSPVIRFILTFLLVTAGMGAQGAMWAFLASEVASWAILLWLLNFRVYPLFLPAGRGSLFDSRTFFAYCLPLFLAGIIDLLLHYTDAFMTGYFLEEIQVGIYGTAVRLTVLVALGTELLNPMFLSIITQQHAEGNTAGVVSTFNNNNRWLSYLTLPIVVVLVILPAESIALVWGESYAAGAWTLAILTLGRTFFYLANTSTFLLYMHGATRLILAVNLFSALLNVVLNWILIPKMGITGAALATAISLSGQAMLIILSAHLYHREGGLQVFFPRILAAAVLPAAVVLALKSVLELGWIQFIGVGLVYLTVYFLLLKSFRAFSEEDRAIGKQILSRIKGKAE
jgi:stage V sporulation protein B